MKIKKSIVEKVLQEEIKNLLKNILEKNEKEDKETKNPTVDTVSSDKVNKTDKNKQIGNMAPKVSKQDKESDVDDTQVNVDVKDPADVALDKSTDASASQVNKSIAGNVVSGVTSVPKSQIMPGYTEISVNFDGGKSPLKILVGSSGTIKYFYNGKIYNKI